MLSKYLLGLALSCVMTFPALAEANLILGQQLHLDATVCLTLDGGTAIAAEAKKNKTGYPAYLIERAKGVCGHAMVVGILNRVIDRFEDSMIGPTKLIEVAVEGKLVYALIDDVNVIEPSTCTGNGCI